MKDPRNLTVEVNSQVFMVSDTQALAAAMRRLNEAASRAAEEMRGEVDDEGEYTAYATEGR